MATMEWLEMSTENCSVQRTLDVIGEKWTMLVLREAFNGVRRFDDMHRHIGLSESVLADRLRKLVAAGVLRAVPYREEGKRSRNEYRLTDKGLDLLPVIVALLQWGDRYCADDHGPGIEVRERATGVPVHAVVRPVGEPGLTARETIGVPGPGARPLAR
ncbi:winged helix-turn-helix transcriptional regulator [Rhodococcus sp. NPDC003318]|uniref:winged helix-turn-helix transcriptional regulator n=1 Tax=Rhodococcus sp. NPDC003318 TaxID=3364503 RepID=UPI00367FDB5C